MERSLTATLRYAQSSPKKMAVVAKIIRGKDATEAVNLLEYMPKKPAKILLKVLKSAIANAKNNAQVDEKALFIKSVDLGKGVYLKRMRFTARSRVHSYIKYRTFVRIVLDTK